MKLLVKSMLPWLLMLAGAAIIIGAPRIFIWYYDMEQLFAPETMLWGDYDVSMLLAMRGWEKQMALLMALGVAAIFVGVHLRQLMKPRW